MRNRITFKADPFTYDLQFGDRITLVGGDSGTGKTVLYNLLRDLRLLPEYRDITLFNYQSDNFLDELENCKDKFIVIDNAEILVGEEARRFINFESSNQYLLFSRNCDGICTSLKSFKIMHENNGNITLEEEVSVKDRLFLNARRKHAI